MLQGRVGVHHVEDAQQSKNFTFKCHRDGTDIYAVNAITFHPVHGTFVTAGSDGAYNFWDKVLPPPWGLQCGVQPGLQQADSSIICAKTGIQTSPCTMCQGRHCHVASVRDLHI